MSHAKNLHVYFQQQTLLKAQVNSAQNIVKTILESRCLSKSTFHAKLLWLSEVHPQELLDCMCQGITVDRGKSCCMRVHVLLNLLVSFAHDI